MNQQGEGRRMVGVRVAKNTLLWGVLCLAAGPCALGVQVQDRLRKQGLPFESEEEVLEYLTTATIISHKKIKQGINQPTRVKLQKGGVEVEAIFRDVSQRVPRLEINGSLRTDFRDDAIFEVAAYRLSRMLELHLVPPTVLRKVNGERGSLQLWIDGALTEGDRTDRNLTPPDQQHWAQMRQIRWIFDSLIHNDDRNLGNSLIDQNWNLWLIDHTRCFYPFDRLLMEDQLTHMDAGLWEKLKSTSQDEVRQMMKRLLEKREVEALLSRWTRLVEHYERQIEERGEGRVLFSLSNDGS